MRRPVRIGAVLLLVTGAAAVVLAGGDEREPEVVAPRQPATPASCRAPDSTTPDVALDPALGRPAAVTVAEAHSVDTGGLAAGVVAQPLDAPAWAVVHDAQVAQAPVGRLARVDLDARTLPQVIDVVSGCQVTALAVSADSLWAGTCDSLGTSTGAEVVQIDPRTGAIVSRVQLPAGCVASMAIADQVWVASAARLETPASLLTIDDSGSAHQALAFAADETLVGLTASGEAVWLSIVGSDGARLVRISGATGEQTSVAVDGATRMLGVFDRKLWTHEDANTALVARDATSGAELQRVSIPGLTAAAASESGVWYQTATPDSLTVTIGRLDAAGTPVTVTTYTSIGPDRTGLPFLGTFSATPQGAWIATQDRLFFLPA